VNYNVLSLHEVWIVFWHLEWGVKKRGLSDNLNFVHVLKKIQGLKKLVIKGYYAKIDQHTWKREWVCRCKLYVIIVVRSMSWRKGSEQWGIKGWEAYMWNEWEEVADIWEVSAENRRFNFIKHITLSHCKASDTYCHEFYEPTALWDICDGFILWLPLKYDRRKNSRPLTPSEGVLSHLILVSHVSVSGSENAVITLQPCICSRMTALMKHILCSETGTWKSRMNSQQTLSLHWCLAHVIYW
jgi:hypothetical protein